MYLMFADEADQDGQREYLISAAIFVPFDVVGALSSAIENARVDAGLVPGDNLKFGSATRPSDRISFEGHKSLKSSVLQIAHDHGVEVCCYVCPHDVASAQDAATRLKWAANTLIGKFDQFLRERQVSGGIAVFDRSTDYRQHEHFVDVFQKGLEFPTGRRRLQNVAGLLQSANGSSHLSSLCDIVCGSCRYAINEPHNPEAGKILLRSVSKMMWGVNRSDGRRGLGDRGFVVRPQRFKSFDYEANVRALVDRLHSYLQVD